MVSGSLLPRRFEALRHGSLAAMAGLIIPLAHAIWTHGAAFIPQMGLSLLVVVGWQIAFARLRDRQVEPSGIVTALLIALLVPIEAPLWQIALGATFGIVIGELIFGGRGYGFVHPATVALAFLMFSFTGGDYRGGPTIPVWTLVPAFVLLVVSGQAAWRTLLGFAVAAPFLLWLLGGDPQAPFLSGAILMAVLFLAADPVASASTNAGRLAHGLLLGTLAALFSQAGELFGSALFATLMAGIFAPTIDQIVIAIHIRRRARQHGR